MRKTHKHAPVRPLLSIRGGRVVHIVEEIVCEGVVKVVTDIRRESESRKEPRFVCVTTHPWTGAENCIIGSLSSVLHNLSSETRATYRGLLNAEGITRRSVRTPPFSEFSIDFTGSM